MHVLSVNAWLQASTRKEFDRLLHNCFEGNTRLHPTADEDASADQLLLKFLENQKLFQLALQLSHLDDEYQNLNRRADFDHHVLPVRAGHHDVSAVLFLLAGLRACPLGLCDPLQHPGSEWKEAFQTMVSLESSVCAISGRGLMDLHTHLLGMGTAHDWMDIMRELTLHDDSPSFVHRFSTVSAGLWSGETYTPKFYGPKVPDEAAKEKPKGAFWGQV